MRGKILLLVLISGVLCTLWTPTALATRQSAQENAGVLYRQLLRDGFNARDDYYHGFLRRGDIYQGRIWLDAGRSYAFIAAGCDDAYDVDIAVLDGDDDVIARDTDASVVGVAGFDVGRSGYFTVLIKMADSTYDGAHWFLQVVED